MNYKLRRALNKISLPGLMTYICFAQGLVYVANLLTGGNVGAAMSFSAPLIMQGEVWRAFTFLFEPVNTNPIWIVVSIIFYTSIGRTVETVWGSDKLTHFIIVGWFFTVILGMISGSAHNYYVFLSLIMVCGTVCPRENVNLYMVLPIEMRYLGMAYAAILVIFLIVRRDITALAPIAAYLVFFGRSQIFAPLINKIKHRNFRN
ncbi:MAG: hypothetical protein J6F31_05370 [Oscillospiraceae bacterium]|nr:hypothetical protein [Oscillospiraceae bacterium]